MVEFKLFKKSDLSSPKLYNLISFTKSFNEIGSNELFLLINLYLSIKLSKSLLCKIFLNIFSI